VTDGSIKAELSYDIAIVGAGLVGASLAAAIACEPVNQNVSIVLIDQGDAPSLPDLHAIPPHFDTRVVALTQASIALLEKMGAWPQVLAQRACAYQHMRVWDAEGTGDISFAASELQQAALGVIVENNIVLSAVLAAVGKYQNVHIIRQQAVSALDNEVNAKKIRLTNGDCIKAALVIAADGAHSHLRELAAFPTRVWSYQHKAIVTTVKTEYSHQYTAWQNFLVTGPLAFLPLADSSERYCSIVWSVDNARADELMALSDENFIVALDAAFESRLGKVESIDKRACFPLVQRHAVDYIAPQLALVGDAAHTIHPLAGQGVNLGLLDAQALANEITRASQRKLALTDFSILRRYQRQRKRHNLEMMLVMEGFKRLFGSRKLSFRWLRNSGMKAVNKLQPIKHWLAKQAMGL
jgi:2-octaprenylphenol hydroxylase